MISRRRSAVPAYGPLRFDLLFAVVTILTIAQPPMDVYRPVGIRV